MWSALTILVLYREDSIVRRFGNACREPNKGRNRGEYRSPDGAERGVAYRGPVQRKLECSERSLMFRGMSGCGMRKSEEIGVSRAPVISRGDWGGRCRVETGGWHRAFLGVARE